MLAREVRGKMASYYEIPNRIARCETQKKIAAEMQSIITDEYLHYINLRDN